MLYLPSNGPTWGNVFFWGGSPYYSCGSDVGIDFDKRQFVCGHLPYVVGAISSWENSKCQSNIGPLCGVCTKVPLWFIGLARKKAHAPGIFWTLNLSGIWLSYRLDSNENEGCFFSVFFLIWPEYLKNNFFGLTCGDHNKNLGHFIFSAELLFA